MSEQTGDENQDSRQLFDIVCIQLQIPNTTHMKWIVWPSDRRIRFKIERVQKHP